MGMRPGRVDATRPTTKRVTLQERFGGRGGASLGAGAPCAGSAWGCDRGESTLRGPQRNASLCRNGSEAEAARAGEQGPGARVAHGDATGASRRYEADNECVTVQERFG